MARLNYRAKPPVVDSISVCKEDKGRVSTIPSDITWIFLDAECISIKEATAFLDVSNAQYTRQLLWTGMIEGVRVLKGKVPTWYLTLSSVRYYARNHRRAFRPRRYDLRIFSDDEQQVREALDKLGITYTLEVAYKAPMLEDATASILEEGGDN